MRGIPAHVPGFLVTVLVEHVNEGRPPKYDLSYLESIAPNRILEALVMSRE